METNEGNEQEDEDNDGTIHSSVYDVNLERCMVKLNVQYDQKIFSMKCN